MIFRRTVEMVNRFKEDGYDIPRVAFNVGAARITDKTFLEDIQTMIPHRTGSGLPSKSWNRCPMTRPAMC